MKAIAISFTLKNQSQEKIFAKLEEIKQENPDSFLIHGFLPRKIVLEKNFALDVVDKLEELFPIQLNMYKGKPLREEMADICSQLNARIYIIGNIIDGVLEEVALYGYKNLNFIHLPIE